MGPSDYYDLPEWGDHLKRLLDPSKDLSLDNVEEAQHERVMEAVKACPRPPPGSSSNRGQPKDRCLMCGKFGHWIKDCPDGDKCLLCGEAGHWAKDCWMGGDKCLL